MKKRIIIYIVAALLIGAGVWAYAQYLVFSGEPTISDIPNVPVVNDARNNDAVQLPLEDGQEDDVRVPIDKVSWIMPKQLGDLSLFTSSNTSATYKLVGTVSSGVHKDKDVIRVQREEVYPGDMGIDYILASKNASGSYTSFELLVYSKDYWNSEINYDEKKVSPLVAKLSELELPVIIEADGESFYAATSLGEWPGDMTMKMVIKDSSIGSLYIADDAKSGKGGFYAKTKDGLIAIYGLKSLETISKQLIKGETYRYVDFGGCGRTNIAAVVNLPLSDFNVIGKALYDGGAIYELKDKNHELYKTLYDMAYFDGEYDVDKKISYEEFTKRQPIIFWKDKYGRMIKFTTEKAVPMAECGKPVIYLYPEETTDVRVEVTPEGGFTKTIPDYGNGWNVVATPASVITNKADGLTYPYLFWEGRGGLYEAPEQGFVVKKEDVESFLDDSLSQYGLIEKEREDFKEFWLPRMTEHPYYFISFYDNKVMDKLAPLNITPKPDSVIRVLMDFKGLDKPIEVEGYKIPQRERKGFTVVEWGGVIQ